MRDRRGRGLATLAKFASTRRAAELGITRIVTCNDLDNAPMLAVNRKLGYTTTVVIESQEVVSECGAPASPAVRNSRTRFVSFALRPQFGQKRRTVASSFRDDFQVREFGLS